ncbi:MAG: iron-containing redox enzyme family protein, partial [Cyanobacteriota bacterium]|nr:iron-containing redox enzyme family protein [Cyanobacteriota bacterium]
MSFFIRLIEATDQQRRQLELVPKLDRMIHKGLSKQDYISFLSDLYFIVWHFCPIMAAAAARCDDRYRQVRFHLYKNIEEEMGHDQWVLDDLRFLGADPEDIKTRKPGAAVQAFIGYNYYYPEHVNPAG